jgi:hypothetical protein
MRYGCATRQNGRRAGVRPSWPSTPPRSTERSRFDRVLFRGYLPLMSGWAMGEFLKSERIERSTLKPFLLEASRTDLDDGKQADEPLADAVTLGDLTGPQDIDYRSVIQ